MRDPRHLFNSSDIRKRVFVIRFIRPSVYIPFNGNYIHTYCKKTMHFLTVQLLHRSALFLSSVGLRCSLERLYCYDKVTLRNNNAKTWRKTCSGDTQFDSKFTGTVKVKQILIQQIELLSAQSGLL